MELPTGSPQANESDEMRRRKAAMYVDVALVPDGGVDEEGQRVRCATARHAESYGQMVHWVKQETDAFVSALANLQQQARQLTKLKERYTSETARFMQRATLLRAHEDVTDVLGSAFGDVKEEDDSSIEYTAEEANEDAKTLKPFVESVADAASILEHELGTLRGLLANGARKSVRLARRRYVQSKEDFTHRPIFQRLCNTPTQPVYAPSAAAAIPSVCLACDKRDADVLADCGCWSPVYCMSCALERFYQAFENGDGTTVQCPVCRGYLKPAMLRRVRLVAPATEEEPQQAKRQRRG